MAIDIADNYCTIKEWSGETNSELAANVLITFLPTTFD